MKRALLVTALAMLASAAVAQQPAQQRPAAPAAPPAPAARPAPAAPAAQAPATPTQTPDAQALQRMQGFQTTGQSLNLESVPQTGRQADAIRRNLERIRLPAGFRIDLYAVVPSARHMAVGPSSGQVFVGTRRTQLWVVVDRDKDRIADEVLRFAPSLTFTQPGPCFSRDGFLFVAEHNRVLVFPAAEFFFEGPDVAVDAVVQAGQLIPREEESFNHGARVCRIGPDNKLYVSLGQPYNVSPQAKMQLYDRVGIGGIVRMDRDGRNREVFARGVRNSVGIAFHPRTGELWFTDNQVDGMGDDIPPGEINRATRAGQHFGFPWYGGGRVRTTDYQGSTPPNDVVYPEAEMAAHAADLGLMFYTGTQFPDRYRGGLFSAQRGSWNRTTPVGARVMFTPMRSDGSAMEGPPEVFAAGWLDEQTGEYYGRIVDIAQLPDGSILVSDDTAGAIYRISYGAR
jgi:glucose/arabinose dehydrogenase